MAFDKKQKHKTITVSDEIAVTVSTGVEPPVPPPPPAITLDEVTPVVVHPKYRAGNTKKVSLFGQMTTITKGSIIDSSGYGPEGMARLRDAGVELAEVK